MPKAPAFSYETLCRLSEMAEVGHSYYEIVGAVNLLADRAEFLRSCSQHGYRLVGYLERTPFQDWRTANRLSAEQLTILQLVLLFDPRWHRMRTYCNTYADSHHPDVLLKKYQLRHRAAFMHEIEWAEAVTRYQNILQQAGILLPCDAWLLKEGLTNTVKKKYK